MNIQNIDGYYWPGDDTECRPAVLKQCKLIPDVLKHIPGREVIVQAGGNCGIFPKLLSKEFKRVFTFEPHPVNFECLKRNVTEENIHYHNAALGAFEKRCNMVTVPGNAGAHYVTEGDDIQMMTIDGLDLDHCDAIWLDIEGHEYFALQGAIYTIDNYKPVIIVEDKWKRQLFGVHESAIPDMLTGMGYKVAAKVHHDTIYVPV